MNTFLMKEINPRSCVIIFGLSLMSLSCNRDEKSNNASVSSDRNSISEKSANRSGPRQTTNNNNNENHKRQQKINSLLRISSNDAINYVQKLREANLISDDEYDDLLSFLLRRHSETALLIAKGDQEMITIAAEQAMHLYYKLSDDAKYNVNMRTLTGLIVRGFGLDRAVQFYQAQQPGKQRVQIVQRIVLYMNEQEHDTQLVGFIDRLEYPEERNAVMSIINESHVYREIGSDLVSFEQNISNVTCDNLKERILSIYLSKAETTNKGLDLADFLTNMEGTVSQDALDAGWANLATRSEFSINETIDILDLFPKSDNLRSSVIRRIAQNEITRRAPEDFINFIDRLSRDEQILVIRSLPLPQSSGYTYDLIPMIPDNELRDIYLESSAKHYAIETRNIEINPYLDMISSSESRVRARHNIETLIKLFEEDGL